MLCSQRFSLRRLLDVAVLAPVALAACSGNSLEPIRPCPGDDWVTIDVSPGTTPRFTWRPACGMAQLGVVPIADSFHGWRLYAADMAENPLPSGIRYGEVPEMGVEDAPADTLVPGVVYQVILLRWLDDRGANGAYPRGFAYFTP